MSEIADRYRRVAGAFTAPAREVSADGWERPAPCEGWTARDVVRHLVECMLRASGQYGPRVAVPGDADEQTRLIAFTGRQP